MQKDIKFVLKNDTDFNNYLLDLIDTIFFCQNNLIVIDGLKYQLEIA